MVNIGPYAVLEQKVVFVKHQQRAVWHDKECIIAVESCAFRRTGSVSVGCIVSHNKALLAERKVVTVDGKDGANILGKFACGGFDDLSVLLAKMGAEIFDVRKLQVDDEIAGFHLFATVSAVKIFFLYVDFNVFVFVIAVSNDGI